jgi:hypothetical protein
MRMALFDRSPQSGALAKDVLLPHQLTQAPRPHPHRQRRIRSWDLGLARIACIE